MGSPWKGSVYFSERVLAYLGPVARTDSHAHHAMQVAVSLAEPLEFSDESGVTVSGHAFLVPADACHAIQRGSSRALFVYLAPEDATGRALLARCSQHSAPAWRSAAECFTSLRSLEGTGLRELERAIRAAIGDTGEPPSATLHPAVRDALRLLPDMLAEAEDIRVGALARRLGLSESRLMHLFREQVGIPIRPYVLWLRLHRAAHEVRRGASLTEAAHAAGFSDSSHLSNTFHRTFGLSPSELIRHAEWLE